MRLLIITFVVTISFVSCKEKPLFDQNKLEGKWSFVKAYRNERETKTLLSAYFEFSQDLVSSNIFEGNVSFEIVEDKLNINAVPKLSFTIVEFEDEFIKLRGQMDVFELEIHLAKYNEEGMEKMDSIYNSTKELQILESENIYQ